jgi:hypothetical protein
MQKLIAAIKLQRILPNIGNSVDNSPRSFKIALETIYPPFDFCQGFFTIFLDGAASPIHKVLITAVYVKGSGENPAFCEKTPCF